VTDAEALRAAEAAGAAFPLAMAFDSAAELESSSLGSLPLWQSIANVVRSDVEETRRSDKHSGVGISGNAHRLFDSGWLSHPAAAFWLVGIAARFDRRPFHSRGCGEIRLIYRLGYRLPATERRAALASLLPLTVSIELLPVIDGKPCEYLVSWWQRAVSGGGSSAGTSLLEPRGPLRSALDDRKQWHRVAINFQRVRWPSAVRPDLGGHAEYVLRAFRWDSAARNFVAAPLENTPAVAALPRGSKRWIELRDWLANPQQRDAIERGIVTLPDRFLATRSLSVTPRGLARLANRPFRQLFRPADFASLSFSSDHAIRSPEAFIRRLDGLSCAGCHQSRAVAGFHWLGTRAVGTEVADVAVAFSPHVVADLSRRRRWLHETPANEASMRPFAERGELDRGIGSACGLGDPGFASWTCPKEARCAAVSELSGDRTVGECVPAVPQVGDACEPARLVSHPDGAKDRAEKRAPIACDGGLVCQATRVGFPGGMCSGGCDPLPAGGRCGAIAILTPFNHCLARGQPFSHCAQQHSHPAGLAACSADQPCRDDYVCSQAKAAAGQGTCIPPYFLLSLRVDGHPIGR
jgi:hypothetical protein